MSRRTAWAASLAGGFVLTVTGPVMLSGGVTALFAPPFFILSFALLLLSFKLAPRPEPVQMPASAILLVLLGAALLEAVQFALGIQLHLDNKHYYQYPSPLLAPPAQSPSFFVAASLLPPALYGWAVRLRTCRPQPEALAAVLTLWPAAPLAWGLAFWLRLPVAF